MDVRFDARLKALLRPFRNDARRPSHRSLNYWKALSRKLRLLNQARVLNDLRAPPGNRLEALKGERAGQYSIRINNQWRICFLWREGGPSNVEVVDYH